MRGNMRVGIVGFGGMGKWHSEIISEIGDLTVAGIYDIKEERMELAKECNLHTYASFEELLEDKSLTLVVIATPNDSHKMLAIQAMRAGKHVVCEKPVTIASKDLQEMIHVSIETGMFFTVHQNRRWDEDFLTIKKIYKEQLLGEVFRIESRVHGSRGIPGDWRQEVEHGGGMVFDWGVHLFDQILLLMEGVALKTVYARTTNVTNQMVDDGFTVILSYENNVEVLIEVGTNNFISLPRWYLLGQNGTAIIHDWELHGEMICSSGVNETDVVPVKTAAGITKTMAPRREDTIHKQALPIVTSDIKDFYKNVQDVILHGRKSEIKLSEVMRVMKLMEVVFESAKQNQVLQFEDSL